MGNPSDDFRILRHRMDALEQEAYARAEDGLGRATRTTVGRVVDGGAMPTEVPGFFKVEMGDIDGTETTGDDVTFAADADGAVAVFLVLGPAVPEVGDLLVAELIGGYWVAERARLASCTTDLEFITYDEPTNVDGLGQVAFDISPPVAGITGHAYLFAVPVHHTSDTASWWSMTLEDVPIPDGTYDFNAILQAGSGVTTTYTRTFADCVIEPVPTCFYCPTLPHTLYYTKGPPQAGTFAAYRQDTILTYSQFPTEYQGSVLTGTTPHWRSPELINPISGDRYILFLKCGPRDSPSTDPNLLTMFPPSGGSFFPSGANLASWSHTNPANTCTPVSWTAGASGGAGTFDGTVTE